MEGMWRQRGRQESSKEDCKWWCPLLRWGNIRTGADSEMRVESVGINTPLLDMLSWRCLLDRQTEMLMRQQNVVKFKRDTRAKDKTFKVISIHDIKL